MREYFIFRRRNFRYSYMRSLRQGIVRTTTAKKKFSHIDSVSRFSDWERAVRLINYMTGTFIENKLKIVTTTVAEIRETEKLIFL